MNWIYLLVTELGSLREVKYSLLMAFTSKKLYDKRFLQFKSIKPTNNRQHNHSCHHSHQNNWFYTTDLKQINNILISGLSVACAIIGVYCFWISYTDYRVLSNRRLTSCPAQQALPFWEEAQRYRACTLTRYSLSLGRPCEYAFDQY